MLDLRSQSAVSSPQPAAVPGFLIELDPWFRVFFGNLRDLIFPQRPPLHLESALAPFWPDVFVHRRLPWLRFLESVAYHILALEALLIFLRFSSLQPLPQPRPKFDHAQVITYQPVEYLPPLDTRRPDSRRSETAPSRQADPELSRQPIISLPREADNRFQTIVTAPVVKLKRDVALPNIVNWSEKSQQPRLAVAPPPVVLASSLSRIAPQVANSVVAPPPDVRAALRSAIPRAPQPAIVEPPPDVESASIGRIGEFNVGHSAVIAPAPQLPVDEQRAAFGITSSGMAGVGAPVVPPPPALGASGYSTAGARMIALNLHPAVDAPADLPSGNRRGAFAATPEGHRGAPGNPGVFGNGENGKRDGSGSARSSKSDLPAGLYVGDAHRTKASPVAGDPAGRDPVPTGSVNPRLVASLAPPGASIPARSLQPEGTAKLSEAERAVFGNRKFYSLTLNMPNLNSAGGSWVIRFAEIKQDSAADARGLAAPTAIRKVDPAYPLQLMRENVAGTVIVYAVIHSDGSVGAVRVLRGIDDRIDPFASRAISQWQFRPATKNGTPVDVEATFLIPFRPGLKPGF
jgi:TonB family protein